MTNTHGWLVIDKPAGITSAKVVSMVKRKLNVSKVGHGGTLDPFAVGLLPIAIGKATKLMKFTLDGEKEYLFTLKFGSETDTGDIEGKVIASSDNTPSQIEIEEIIPKFIGYIEQIPPIYSAIKIDGKRAYKMARDGLQPEMKPRQIYIKSLNLEKYENSMATMRVTCGKGTYIRSLGTDIAKSLNSVGHLIYLRRTRVGEFKESDSIELDNLDSTKLLPMNYILNNVPYIEITMQEAEDLRYGRAISVSSERPGEIVAKLKSGDIIALGAIMEGKFYPKRVV